MRPITVSVGPLAAAVANNIATSQTPTSSITLNGAAVVGGVAILDTARRVLVTTVADESAKRITIVGTDLTGQVQTDIITGPNATTGQSNLDFKTITSMSINVAAAGALTVGTNGVASSGWVRFDPWANAQSFIQAIVTGTANYTVQVTAQDPNDPTLNLLPYQVTWNSALDATLVGASTNIVGSFTISPTFARVVLNSGSGSVQTTFTQINSAAY